MSNGKGSRQRTYGQKFRDNYDAIFKKPSKGSITDVLLKGRKGPVVDQSRSRWFKESGMERYKLIGSDRVLLVHPRTKCKGQHCCIHNPSDHHMKDWPQNWREDRGIMERVCPHGIGHPDPDDPTTDRIHGCDGCCTPPSKLKPGKLDCEDCKGKGYWADAMGTHLFDCKCTK